MEDDHRSGKDPAAGDVASSAARDRATVDMERLGCGCLVLIGLLLLLWIVLVIATRYE